MYLDPLLDPNGQAKDELKLVVRNISFRLAMQNLFGITAKSSKSPLKHSMLACAVCTILLTAKHDQWVEKAFYLIYLFIFELMHKAHYSPSKQNLTWLHPSPLKYFLREQYRHLTSPVFRPRTSSPTAGIDLDWAHRRHRNVWI